MKGLKLQDFFSLPESFHTELFTESIFVWNPIERLESYLKQQKLGQIAVKVPSTVFLINPELISIGEETVIEPGAYIQGPTIIGPRNTIRYGAYIRGNIITGDSCVIGHGTELKNSILLNNVKASHFNYIGDSMLGNEVDLGGGAILANFRFDKEEIIIHYQGEKIRTQLHKFGAIIGDKTQIGCNSVSNPGTLIYPNSKCLPCSNIKGIVSSNSF